MFNLKPPLSVKLLSEGILGMSSIIPEINKAEGKSLDGNESLSTSIREPESDDENTDMSLLISKWQ